VGGQKEQVEEKEPHCPKFQFSLRQNVGRSLLACADMLLVNTILRDIGGGSAHFWAMETPPSLPLAKPKTFMIAGIGLLIMGIFYFCGMLMNMVIATMPAMRESNPVFKIMEQNPDYAAAYNISLVLNGILGLMALGGGIGLLMSRNWGRKLGIAWGVLYLLALPYGLWMTNKYVRPAMTEMQHEIMKNQSAEFGKGMEIFTTAVTILTTVFWAAGCIAVIYFLARPKMRAWCALQETRKAS
jgi:hypothetical protein